MPAATTRTARVILLLLGALAMLAGIAGGLVRVGVAIDAPQSAIARHGALMVAGFLGTVISLERAVAVGGRIALLAPATAAVGVAALLFQIERVLDASFLLAPVLLVALSAEIVRRQFALHTVLLLVAAMAWLAGNALYVAHVDIVAVAGWWFDFLVLTVAAERLEMTRLMKRSPLATPLFLALTVVLIVGSVAVAFWPARGAYGYGTALVGVAAWLYRYDLARRTIRTTGYSRYAAVALLAGYAWLVVAGLAWVAGPIVGSATLDIALHALGLGFVVSMIFAHAPVIVPVVAATRLRYTPLLYLPLALLHASLILRFGSGWGNIALLRWGSIGNASAILLFAATVVWSLRTPERKISASRQS